MLLAAALSVLIGLSLGLLGGGGSILALPVLIHVVGLAPKTAIATSLLVVSGASFAATVVHARAGRVRYRIGALFGAASMAGAFVGGRLSGLLPDSLLVAAFTAVMIVTGVMMLRKRPDIVAGARCASRRCTTVLGAAVGLLTGVVGAGGGFLVVPALAVLGGLSMREAIATSVLVIGANSLAGFLGQLGHVSIDARITVAVTGIAVAGSYVGALASQRVRSGSLRRGFAVFVLGMASVMVYGQAHALSARIVRVLVHDANIGTTGSIPRITRPASSSQISRRMMCCVTA